MRVRRCDRVEDPDEQCVQGREVGVDRIIPEYGDARVGDHDIEMAEFCDAVVDHALDCLPVGDVGDSGNDAPVQLLHEGHGLLEVIGTGHGVGNVRQVAQMSRPIMSAPSSARRIACERPARARSR